MVGGVMKSMMRKTTLREIWQSLGRYLAIFAIVAMGVGFFAGLKITKAVMVESANAYLDEKQLYDYRLLSTLGFEAEDVAALAAKDDVRAVEGAVNADILYVDGEGNEDVIRAHSLMNHINGLSIVAGRLPQSDTECIVDTVLYDESAIGSSIVFSENNDQDDLDNFVHDRYTIVGVAQASAYIQFERGTTSLGNGRIGGFMYLLPEGFATDYFTEIYVRFDQDYPIYSAEYDAYMKEKEKLWEDYCKAQGERRYQAIVADAEDELADAEDELADEKADAEAELADARKELLDAEAELADGQAQLRDGENEIADNRAMINSRARELADARRSLDERRAELAAAVEQANAVPAEFLDAEALQQLQVSMQQFEAAAAQLDDAERQIADGEVQLARGRRELAGAEAELEESRQKLLDAEAELADGWSEYNDAYAEYEEKIADAEREIADAREEIAGIETPDTYVLDRDTNIGYACFENDSSIVEGLANVFPVFFFMVAALVCMTTMNRMVEEQRTQIGVLKALGYGEAAIMGKYLFYSGSAALTGCIAGYLLGIHLFPFVIWQAYGMMYKMGDIVFVTDGATALLCLACALLCSMGTTWFSCHRELREVAAELMRPRTPRAGKRVFLEWIPFIWNRLKFLQKVSVRNIIRYKRRFLMMVIGISGCTALLVTGFGIRDSATDIADQQFGEIQTFELDITLKNGVQDVEAASLDPLKEALASYGGTCIAALETTVDMEVSGNMKAVSLIVVEDPAQLGSYIDLHTSAGEAIAYPQNGEAVICEKLSERYGLGVGDTILLYDEDRKEIRVVVSGICENYMYNYVYLSAQTYEESVGEIAYKNLFANLAEGEDAHAAGAALMKMDGVTAVSVNADMLTRFASMMGSMNYIVFVIIACAAALAFIVLYNLNNINITERIREIATIKVLGFYKNETAAYVFRENTVLTAIGCAAGLLLGKALHLYVMHKVDIDLMSFDIHIRAVSYLLSVLLTFVFTWVVNRMMSVKLDTINMTESLKSVD